MKKGLDYRCARDATRLEWHDARGFACYQCGTCRGLFADSGSLAFASRGALAAPTAMKASLQALPPGQVDCPGCSAAMRILMHKGVEIDVCPACYTFWLDGDEWERVIGTPSTRGSKFGRSEKIAGAAAVGGAVAATVAVAASGSSPGPMGRGSDSVASQVVGGVADFAGDAVIEVVFDFIGEALGSLF